MLFHITISHSPNECPGRRPTEPPDLVAPSDRREALARELGVTLHFVLWGASCMLWAQPEHLAFAVVEAEDVESAVQYVGSLVPQSWTCAALPVWNLPAQLRLVRQVRVAPPLKLGQGLPSASAGDQAQPAPVQEPPRPRTAGSKDRLAALAAEAEPAAPLNLAAHASSQSRAGGATDPGSIADVTPMPGSSPGTITRLLRDLDGDAAEVATGDAAATQAPKSDDVGALADMSTRIIGQSPARAQRTARAWLVVTAGPAKGKTFVVTQEGAIIGRLPESPVSIGDERLSREHAKIDYRTDSFWLTDLGSTNGTALNGVLLKQPHVLASGDTVELGSSVLVITIEPSTSG
jgi:FHA domain